MQKKFKIIDISVDAFFKDLFALDVDFGYLIRALDSNGDVEYIKFIKLDKFQYESAINIFRTESENYFKDVGEVKVELFYIHSIKHKSIELLASLDTFSKYDFQNFDYKLVYSPPIIYIPNFYTDFEGFDLKNHDYIQEMNGVYVGAFNKVYKSFNKEIKENLKDFIVELNKETADLDVSLYQQFKEFDNYISIINVMFFKLPV